MIYNKTGIIISVHGIGSHFQDIGFECKYNLDGDHYFFKIRYYILCY